MADDAEKGLVLFIQEQDLEARPREEAWGLPSKVLRDDAEAGALTLRVETQGGWQDERRIRRENSLEIYMLKGDLSIENKKFFTGDFVRISRNTVYGTVSSDSGGQFLMFFDGPSASKVVDESELADSEEWIIARAAETPWEPALVAKEAGVELSTEVKNLKNDPVTGARTFLVSSGGGVTMPWETHPVSEEGYLLEGRHRLEECLPSGLQSGVYEVGGYFYRPPELMHMGPGSTHPERVIWLIRTPSKLVDVFHKSCPFD